MGRPGSERNNQQEVDRGRGSLCEEGAPEVREAGEPTPPTPAVCSWRAGEDRVQWVRGPGSTWEVQGLSPVMGERVGELLCGDLAREGCSVRAGPMPHDDAPRRRPTTAAWLGWCRQQARMRPGLAGGDGRPAQVHPCPR